MKPALQPTILSLSRRGPRHMPALPPVAPRTTRQTQTPALAILVSRRWSTPAPNLNGTKPLMSRRADRELPDVESYQFKWSRTLPLFILCMAVATVAIINYQKSSSSTVAAILYALRTSARARELLGDEVYFAHRIPWIGGKMAQLQGVIDINFRVRGTRAEGVVKFNSQRHGSRGLWETLEYWVEVEGERVNLLEEEGGGKFMPIVVPKGQEDVVNTRGFRQAYKG